jgi:ATP-dependent DNA helicase RecG
MTSFVRKLSLSDGVERIPKTHSRTVARFHAAGITTIRDLLEYYPARYVDYSICTTLDKAQAGEIVTIKGTITSSKNTYAKRITIQTVMIEDGTGTLKLTWFNQPYITQLCKIGLTLAVAGEVKITAGRYTMQPDEYEILRDDAEARHTGALVPIYSQRKGLTTRLLREKIAIALQITDLSDLTEWLPGSLITSEKLLPYEQVVRVMHSPPNSAIAAAARKRIAFDELIITHLANLEIRRRWQMHKLTRSFSFTPSIDHELQSCIRSLPFTLTSSQSIAWQQIKDDLSKPTPMNRFLQGDVGSGKTIVALLASFACLLQKSSVLCMCPTEVLARQHYATFQRFLPTPYATHVRLITSSTKSKKQDVPTDPAIYIGTHALLTHTTDYGTVGLIIIDEQHRFGVSQRAQIKNLGQQSHLLTMTATPIPRTMALTLFGDLDITSLTDKPAGRLITKTYVPSPAKRTNAYEWIRSQIIQTKCQVFIICPRIDEEKENEGQKETVVSMRAAVAEAARLQKDIFPDLRIALVHGKLKAKEKDQIMNDFKDHKYDILVSTTVIEVGIDVPNASIILIEGAERFGLAQLHQLRGRVGRGNTQGHCILFTSPDTAIPERLHFFARTHLGQELAEYDFRERGPGDIYGTAQSGTGSLRIANLFDYALVSHTKDIAMKLNAQGLTPSIRTKIAPLLQISIAQD